MSRPAINGFRAAQTAIDAALPEWLRGQEDLRSGLKSGDLSKIRDEDLLFGWSNTGASFLNAVGRAHIESAARTVLRETDLERRITRLTCRQAIFQCFLDEIDRSARRGKTFKSEIVLRNAIAKLADIPVADGLYILPLTFAPGVKNSDASMGVTRLISRAVFEREFGERISQRQAERPSSGSARLYADWHQYLEAYDHVAMVKLTAFEEEMAWEAARETAEFYLNIVRITFGYRRTKDIRIAGGFAHERIQSALRVTPEGDLLFRSSIRWPGASFGDDWMRTFDETLNPFQALCASFASWLASGRNVTDPVLKRLRYANRLISETYSEPHDHIRIVRLMAALESLAMLGPKDKAHHLAYRCASVGGWCNPGHACEIYDAVRFAYSVRSAVVHGDGASVEDTRRAFFGVEQHALPIVVGFLDFFAKLRARHEMQSVTSLRRAVDQSIDWYFWDLL
jgi:hypothetical protein